MRRASVCHHASHPAPSPTSIPSPRPPTSMGCRLLATHDDYGMTTQLPPGAATGVTTLFREPLDRVLSMYEFSVHISGRSMGLDLKQLPDETLYAARRKMREHYRNLVPTDTRNVWPWTSLSVTMEEDLWDRQIHFPPSSPLSPPLPQLAGITNNSVLPSLLSLMLDPSSPPSPFPLPSSPLPPPPFSPSPASGHHEQQRAARGEAAEAVCAAAPGPWRGDAALPTLSQS
ncbi:unnamed protein product [Closterium sp. NIES-53]